MDNSRPSSPEQAPLDLWSSILDSVSSSRSTPAKQILLLGEPSSGKSVIASALLQKPLAEEEHRDFAVGYEFADVRDDADEGMCVCCVCFRVSDSVLFRHAREAFVVYRPVFGASVYCALAKVLTAQTGAFIDAHHHYA